MDFFGSLVLAGSIRVQHIYMWDMLSKLRSQQNWSTWQSVLRVDEHRASRKLIGLVVFFFLALLGLAFPLAFPFALGSAAGCGGSLALGWVLITEDPLDFIGLWLNLLRGGRMWKGSMIVQKIQCVNCMPNYLPRIRRLFIDTSNLVTSTNTFCIPSRCFHRWGKAINIRSGV